MIRNILVCVFLLNFIAACGSGTTPPTNDSQGAPATLEMLQTQLQSDLASLGVDWDDAVNGRVVAATASDPNSQAVLAFDDGSSVLSWGYYSTGDYDQNGEVNVADLTPIAINFGSAGPFDANSALSAIDGDNNGEINLADVTPIAVNFGSTVSAYNVYWGTSIADYPSSTSSVSKAASATTALDPVAFDTATGTSASDRLQFEFTVPSPQAGAVYWVVPTDGTNEGTVSTAAGDVPASGAILTTLPDPPTGDAPLTVDFDASLSTSPGNTITDYEWDFDGDGVFNETDNGESAAQGNATAQYIYTDNNATTATVRTTDSSANTDTAIAGVLPTDSSTATEIGLPDGMFMHSPQFLMIDGNPAMVYLATNSDVIAWGQLTYSRALDADGNTWAAPVVLAPLVDDVAEFAFAIIGGKPAVAYAASQGAYGTQYRSSTDATGTAWNAAVAIADKGVASPLTLQEVNGMPAATYEYPVDPFEFRYSRATSIDGSTWGAHVVIQASAPMGAAARDSAAAIIDGNPALMYQYTDQDSTPNYSALKYVRANDVDGATWGAAVVIAEEENVSNVAISLGFQISLLEIDTGPIAGYLRSDWTDWPDGIQDAYFVEANDAVGSSWSVPEKIADPGAGDQGTSSLPLYASPPGSSKFTSGSEYDANRWTLSLKYKIGVLDINWLRVRLAKFPKSDDKSSSMVNGKTAALKSTSLEEQTYWYLEFNVENGSGASSYFRLRPLDDMKWAETLSVDANSSLNVFGNSSEIFFIRYVW